MQHSKSKAANSLHEKENAKKDRKKKIGNGQPTNHNKNEWRGECVTDAWNVREWDGKTVQLLQRADRYTYISDYSCARVRCEQERTATSIRPSMIVSIQKWNPF